MRITTAALALSLVLALPSPPVLLAQDAATLEAGLGSLRAKNRFLISGTLALTDAEAGAFWPLYDERERDLKSLDTRSARLIAELLRSYASLPPARAEALVEEHLHLEEDRLKLLRAHVEKVRRALPAAKLARYVQLQNRLDLMARYDLAQRLPLVGQP